MALNLQAVLGQLLALYLLQHQSSQKLIPLVRSRRLPPQKIGLGKKNRNRHLVERQGTGLV